MTLRALYISTSSDHEARTVPLYSIGYLGVIAKDAHKAAEGATIKTRGYIIAPYRESWSVYASFRLFKMIFIIFFLGVRNPYFSFGFMLPFKFSVPCEAFHCNPLPSKF